MIPTPVQAVPAIPIPPDDPDADAPVAAVPGMPGGVVPDAFACGADVEILSYASSSGYYRAECAQPLSVEFRVGEHHDSSIVFTFPQATDASGNSTFRPVDLGDVIIRQDSVSGYAMPQVFCRNPDSPTGSWTYMPIDWASTGYYDYSIWETLDAENPTLECEWYNMPLSDLDWERRIGITRYYCLDPDMSQPLARQCVANVDHSFTFRVSTEVWDPEFRSVEWTSFLIDASPMRALTITQQLPDGFSLPVAECRIVDYNQRWEAISDLGWLEADAEGGIAFEPIGINNALDCDWYSIVHSPGRSLTVYSHTCPSQVFTTHEVCGVDGTVHQYELEYWENDTWQHHSTVMTASNGSYVWADMRPGTYRLVQDGGAWCHMTTDHPTGVGLIEVVSGQDTIVRVYTCDGGPGSGGGLPGRCVNINRLCPRS